VLEGIALEYDARAVAKAGELFWLELAHGLNVGQGELVHVVNLVERNHVKTNLERREGHSV
jgi:hypothetical protein